MTRAMRSRSLPLGAAQIRGGGGFHKPAPKLMEPYKHDRRIPIEEINLTLYHDYAPEFHMHLHSQWIQNSKQGYVILASFCLFVLLPIWQSMKYLLKKLNAAELYFGIRPGKDHQHMAPAIYQHLKANNFENKPDFLGRRNGSFYKNYIRQDMSNDLKTSNWKILETRGFKA